MISYAITNPSTLDFKNLESDLKKFSQKASMIVYRDKNNPNYDMYATRFVELSQKFTFNKVLIHGDYVLASVIKADGVHLTSRQLDMIPEAKSKNLFVVASTHNMEELKRAEELGADMVTFSPIFNTPNKGNPVGLEVLKEAASKVKIPIIALGGILTKTQIEACRDAGAEGFASIRYFES